LNWEGKRPAQLAMQSQKSAARLSIARVSISDKQNDHKIKQYVANCGVNCTPQGHKVEVKEQVKLLLWALQ